jgi:hypothetical protein
VNGRKPDAGDFKAWMAMVYAHAKTIDPALELDWNSMATGFLIARGVDVAMAADWELCASMTCDDEPRYTAAVAALEAP